MRKPMFQANVLEFQTETLPEIRNKPCDAPRSIGCLGAKVTNYCHDIGSGTAACSLRTLSGQCLV